jgi:chromate transporter
MIFLRLFYEFFKTGLFAVGGGLATLPFLRNMADTTGWFTKAQLADMLAVSESTPGPIGVNTATYVGFTTAGIPGAIVATVGLVTPSVIVILIIARMLKKFRDNRIVENAFYGLRPASTGLIAAAGLSVVPLALLKTGTLSFSGGFLAAVKWPAVILAAVLVVLTNWVKPTKNLHPILFIAASAVIGVVFHFAGV